jgi:dihydrofolate synthase / folylpolyglutamate synthase
VIGLLRDKDIDAVLKALVRDADIIIATSSPSPRGASAREVAEIARKTCNEVHVSENMDDAIELARRISGRSGVISVAGSLYNIAAAQDAVR